MNRHRIISVKHYTVANRKVEVIRNVDLDCRFEGGRNIDVKGNMDTKYYK